MIIESTEVETRIVNYTVYTCSDGSTFRNKYEAQDYEKYLNAKEIVNNLRCRKENFVGFEQNYDSAYYCSSKEEFDSVCIVIKYENIDLRYTNDDNYIQYGSQRYEDKGWYYFKVDKDYVDDYSYLWRLYIDSFNTERNNIQNEFNIAKRKFDAFKEVYSQLF